MLNTKNVTILIAIKMKAIISGVRSLKTFTEKALLAIHHPSRQLKYMPTKLEKIGIISLYLFVYIQHIYVFFCKSQYSYKTTIFSN